MIKTVDTHPHFEALARSFLAQHPSIRHEWREIHDISGGRTDVICEPGATNEVFASLTSDQITVGTAADATDFEQFGRRLSDQQLAEEAFGQFVRLLTAAGVVKAA